MTTAKGAGPSSQHLSLSYTHPRGRLGRMPSGGARGVPQKPGLPAWLGCTRPGPHCTVGPEIGRRWGCVHAHVCVHVCACARKY